MSSRSGVVLVAQTAIRFLTRISILNLTRVGAFTLETSGGSASVAQVTAQVALEQATDLGDYTRHTSIESSIRRPVFDHFYIRFVFWKTNRK